MAIYTPLSASDLVTLLAGYDLGALRACDGIAEGVENTNYKLTTDRGRFILTIFEKRTNEADLPFFVGVMERLAQRGFPAPRPIVTRDDALLARVQGKPALIVTFLDGVWPREPTLAHCTAVGEALARMHVALDGFAPTRPNALSLDGWEALIKPRLAQSEALRPGLAAFIERDMAEVRAAWPTDLPRGAIHADLFPDNALFVGDTLTGVIDFYFACTDFLAYDLAVCINAWCFDRTAGFQPAFQYNATRGATMIAAYERVRPLSDAEREALQTLGRGAALRFFATRLADWSATPAGATVTPKDPLEYADKLAWHRET
ncbi:MAG: homoserine kinase [Hyphomonadaceae bacterium]|nr:homoserine kinase [Hyphomonadaceae bacterium]